MQTIQHEIDEVGHAVEGASSGGISIPGRCSPIKGIIYGTLPSPIPLHPSTELDERSQWPCVR